MEVNKVPSAFTNNEIGVTLLRITASNFTNQMHFGEPLLRPSLNEGNELLSNNESKQRYCTRGHEVFFVFEWVLTKSNSSPFVKVTATNLVAGGLPLMYL